MTLTNLQYISINYRHDLDILFLRWHHSTTAEKCKEGYKYALSLAHENKAFYWLVDIRSRGLSQSKYHLQFLENRLKQFHKKNKSGLFVAKLITPHDKDQKLVTEIKKPYNLVKTLNFEYFFTEKHAITWLQKKQIV